VRGTLLLVLVGACGFEHGLAASRTDDAPPLNADAAPDARVAPYCDPTDPALVACYQFEGNANDASPNMLNATTSNVTFPVGRIGSALLFGATSAAEVADSAALDVPALTIEAWINPSSLPTSGGRMGILDMNGQWGLFLHETGQLRCTASTTLTVSANIVANEWTHVACTYDGTTATIYVNGVAATPTGTGGALSTAGNTGLSLAADNPADSGSRLIGMIDELRLMSRARTAHEICVDAGACAPPVQ
jgi:hypothetical protein